MENQLVSAVEKGSQILRDAKGMNISQKWNCFTKMSGLENKLSNEEIYILSQKNLVKAMDRLQDKVSSR